MNRVVIFLILFSGIGHISCNKNLSKNSITYRGIILHCICCQDVIQTIGPDYLGQDNWIDSNGVIMPVYNHVFKVSNPCQFGNHVEGDTIKFKIISQQVQDCACCMLYVKTPDESYPVQVIK